MFSGPHKKVTYWPNTAVYTHRHFESTRKLIPTPAPSLYFTNPHCVSLQWTGLVSVLADILPWTQYNHWMGLDLYSKWWESEYMHWGSVFPFQVNYTVCYKANKQNKESQIFTILSMTFWPDYWVLVYHITTDIWHMWIYVHLHSIHSSFLKVTFGPPQLKWFF